MGDLAVTCLGEGPRFGLSSEEREEAAEPPSALLAPANGRSAPLLTGTDVRDAPCTARRAPRCG